MAIVKIGEEKNPVFKGVTCDGVIFACRIAKTASAQNLSPLWFNLKEVQARITLYRAGKSYEIASGNLKALAMESMFDKATFDFAKESGDWVDMTEVADGVNAPEYGIIPLKVDFETHLNLRKDDRLEVALQIGSGILVDSSKPVDVNGCHIDVSVSESVGIETHIPKIKVQALTSNDNEIDKGLGDNVTSITFLNMDKAGYKETNSIIKNVVVKGDKGVHLSDNYAQLVAKQILGFETLSDARKRGQSFRFYKGVELDECKLIVQTNNERITAGNNAIVYRTFHTDRKMVEIANLTQEKHNAEARAKLGFGAGSSVSAIVTRREQLLKERAE